jgi:hypothetical protein
MLPSKRVDDWVDHIASAFEVERNCTNALPLAERGDHRLFELSNRSTVCSDGSGISSKADRGHAFLQHFDKWAIEPVLGWPD